MYLFSSFTIVVFEVPNTEKKEEMFLGGSVQTPPIALMLSFQSIFYLKLYTSGISAKNAKHI